MHLLDHDPGWQGWHDSSRYQAGTAEQVLWWKWETGGVSNLKIRSEKLLIKLPKNYEMYYFTTGYWRIRAVLLQMNQFKISGRPPLPRRLTSNLRPPLPVRRWKLWPPSVPSLLHVWGFGRNLGLKLLNKPFYQIRVFCSVPWLPNSSESWQNPQKPRVRLALTSAGHFRSPSEFPYSGGGILCRFPSWGKIPSEAIFGENRNRWKYGGLHFIRKLASHWVWCRRNFQDRLPIRGDIAFWLAIYTDPWYRWLAAKNSMAGWGFGNIVRANRSWPFWALINRKWNTYRQDVAERTALYWTRHKYISSKIPI